MKRLTAIGIVCTASLHCSSLLAQIPLSPDRIVITNERRINSEELEFSPVFYQDGVVFITTRHESLLYNVKDKNADGVNIMAIFHSQRDGEGFLQEPVAFSNELMSRVHEGPLVFDRTGETIFFTRNETVEVASDGFKKLQVYEAKKENEIWGGIKKLPFNNTSYNYLHPAISADNDLMIIASDVPGGYGGKDLYAVRQVGGEWTEMTNLGPNVNTPGNEVFPFLGADGALYFASDGLGGLGGLDLFFTRQIEGDKTWRNPVNLESPFNSTTDDFGFIVDRDNKNGYFSSDRKGGFGKDDIYTFYIEGDMMPLAGGGRNLNEMVVKDEDGNPLEGVTVSAIHFNEVALSAGDERVVSLLPGDNGKDNFILDVNSEGMGRSADTNTEGKADLMVGRGSYVVKITKDGYLPEYVTVTPETDLSKLNVQLRRAANCLAFSGQVLLLNSRTPVAGAEIHILDVESNETILIYSDASGRYDYCLPCNRTFTVYATRNGATSAPVVANAKEVACAPDEKISQTLYLGAMPLYAGMSIELPNIYFNFDDAALRPDAYKDLDEVAGMLNNYPGMKLELGSSTDARGSERYNNNLSERRSASVYRYLVSRGIASDRLTPRGYGESQIRNRCTDGVACSEREHQYNRRTEIKILELGEPTTAPASITPPIASDNEHGSDAVALLEGEPDDGKGGQDMVNAENGGAAEGEEDAPAVKVSTEGSIGGSFAVIAGTFANKDYAERRSTLLTGMGYGETSIVRQDRNGLYAVWVKTFDQKEDAFGLVNELRRKQLSAYILRR